MHVARLRVDEVAKKKKMSMGKLSRNSDVSYKTVKLIFSNPERDVNLSTLVKLAQALKVNTCDLFELVPGPEEDDEPDEDETE
jgi:DNA-binding Xre family transcriptional regulator